MAEGLALFWKWCCNRVTEPDQGGWNYDFRIGWLVEAW